MKLDELVPLLSHFPGGASGKGPVANVGDRRDVGSIPGSGRSPGVRNGNPLQFSCLENPIDRGAWQATVHGVARVGQDLATKPSFCGQTLVYTAATAAAKSLQLCPTLCDPRDGSSPGSTVPGIL